jgi:phosphoglycerate dehydrogenase-like enzyme
MTTAAGVHADPLAEFALLGLLWLAKGGPRLLQWQRDRHWERHTSRQLAGQRVLIVGAGSIGRRVAELCAAAKMEVWAAVRPGRSAQLPGVTRFIGVDELTGVLAEVDALVLACPLTDETHHLIGAKQLAALPRHAVLVNVARGQVVDEPALVESLSTGQLAGAVLDVFEQEPLPADSPLWDMPNVLVSPHSASTVAEENSQIVDLFIDNLRRFLAGEPLRNEYSRDRAY